MSADLQISTVLIELSQHETESKYKINKIIKYFFPTELRDQLQNLITVHHLQGYHKNRIKLFKIQSGNKKINSKIFTELMNNFSPKPDFELFWERFNSKNNSLYLRINKQEVIKSRQFRLDEGSDIVKIVFKFFILNSIKNNESRLKKFLNKQLFG
jgi:RNA binding exosome subunit